MSSANPDDAVPATAAPYVRRLRELANAATGLPITSHRAFVGTAVVAGKRVFRKSLQPFINELLLKQTRFNETVADFTTSIYRDLQSLEGAVFGVRAALDLRLTGIEQRLEKIEARLGAIAGDAAPSQPEKTNGVHGPHRS